ncbi:hypothetical protein BD410DRAFT_106696 [Rickenella mellea]|uniref:Autophagy-related protein 13 n=1 Tax=Rickenella mellea TaxID=50990 RepID=A0A4Y7PJC8_9AGAM|nr:hypothetical protein BD410DRAFT_106696 [Rickenella mellea]
MAQRSAIEKADQVAHRFFLKFALIVDNARETVEPLAHESATARNDKWFNIETPDSEKYSEQLRAYRYISKLQSPPPPFEIQVLLTIPELRNNQVLVFNVSPTSRVRMDPTISHIVLESWQLEFTPSSVGDDIRLAAVYKQGITLYRSLFSLLRVLPAWRLCQKLRRRRTKHGLIPNGSLGIEIRVRTDTGVLRIGEYFSL